MDVNLEFEKFYEEDNTTFYKYNIDGNLVWFSQHMDTGKIYHVDMSLKEPYCNYADMYVDIDTNEFFYPIGIKIVTNSRTIDLYGVDIYIQKLEYLKELYVAALSIFDKGKHYELYKKGEINNE